jgi:hypothetical protein
LKAANGSAARASPASSAFAKYRRECMLHPHFDNAIALEARIEDAGRVGHRLYTSSRRDAQPLVRASVPSSSFVEADGLVRQASSSVRSTGGFPFATRG